MAKKLIKDNVTFIALDGEATPKTDFNTKEQATHKISGLPLWTAEGFLVDADGRSIVKINIASKEQPKFPEETRLSIEGDLLYTPYVTNANRLGESYTVVGKLVPAKPANRGE